jgi:hypothetical protein
LVIQQETASTNRQECLPRGNAASEMWAGVLEDYKKQNQTPRLFSRSFSIDTPYKLISRTGISDSFGGKTFNEGWKSFYSRYPDSQGYIELSAVGFNADKTKAFVYIAHHCDTLCGASGYTFLEKRNGKWVKAPVNASFCGWIS